MDIETKKSFNKLKHYLTLFNNAYFDKDHMWILYDFQASDYNRPEPKLYRINNKIVLSMDYLQWI